MSPENFAQFEYHKMQLMGSLNQVATTLRECANVAENFAQVINTLTYNGNPPPFPHLPNGQYPMPVAPPMPAHDDGGRKRKSRVDDTDGKRKKKPKDPNAPKRPPSSYLLFQNDIRNELKAKNPGMANNELLGAISKLWAEMPPEQKDAYEARNRVAKEEWLSQKAIYESGKGVGPSSSPVIPAVIPAKAIAVAAAPPPVASLSSDESSVEEDSSDDSSSEEAAPPPKKSKKELAAVAAKEEGKKEKKHKKSKA